MTISFSTKPTNQDVAFLYSLIGEAMCMIQHLEGALNVSITLKKDVKYPHRISKEEADNFLKKYRSSITLGQAIQLVKKNGLYSDTLRGDLKAFLEERNWLVHKFLHQHLDDIQATSARDRLFHRIKSISDKAKMLREAVEADLIDFSESIGIDMSRVRAYIRHYSIKSEAVPSPLKE